MSAAPERLAEQAATACLLALGACDARSLDPVGCLQFALDVLVELGPVAGACAEVALPGLPPLALVSGSAVDGAAALEHAVTLDGAVVGRLRAVPLPGAGTDVVAGAAMQISSLLAESAHADADRRRRAEAAARALGSGLDPDDPARGVEELAVLFAALPGTTSAELIVDHPALGVPVVARGGTDLPGDLGATWVTTREMAGGLAVVRRCGVPGSPARDDAAVAELLACLEAGLDRLEDDDRRAREASADPATGLGHPDRFEVVLGRAVVRALRRCEPVALMVLELQGFAVMADALGPEVSGLVVRACARVLHGGAYGYAPAFRLGPDELAVVVPGADVLTALAMAEQMAGELPTAAAAVLPPGAVLAVAAGIATFPDSAPDAAGVLAAARAACADAVGDGSRAVRVAPFVDALEDVPAAPGAERRRRARLRRTRRT